MARHPHVHWPRDERLTRYSPSRHAEPEQAAQLMNPNNRPPTGAQYNKPMPPPPQQAQNARPDDRYNSRPPPSQGFQSPGPIPGSYGSSSPAPPQSQNWDQQTRYNTSYNSNPQPPPPRFSSQQQQPYSQAPPQQQQRPSFTSPPPPASYGQGPPPSGAHNRPPIPQQQRPPTVGPPPRDQNDRDGLWSLFMQVDKDRSGQLTENELRRALVNGDYTAFDPHTVKMMIRMFDTDRSGTVNFEEFCGLWGFLAAWRGLFDRFDTDRSGNISLQEFTDALVAFGYRLSPQFVQLLFNTYAKTSRGRGDEGHREKGLSFDLFVQACISLKRMTDVFKRYDEDRDGYITLSL